MSATIEVFSRRPSDSSSHTPILSSSNLPLSRVDVPNGNQLSTYGPFSPNTSYSNSRVSTAASRSSSRGKFMSKTTSASTSRACSPGTPGYGIASASKVSDADKFEAMMGRKDLNRIVTAQGETLYREEFCGACGIIHCNPDLMDMYNTCKACQCTLREPSSLRKRYEGVPQTCQLEILYATYGDPFDPLYVVDITSQVIRKVREFTFADRLAFKPSVPIDEMLGLKDIIHTVVDPRNARSNKQLRVRYRIGGIHGTLVLDFLAAHTIPSPFLLIVPKTRYLRIFSGTYGFPKGISSTGRMSYDVSEILQSMVDQNGGSYLNISSFFPIARTFGDPCPGYPKDLRMSFEIVGRSGSVTYSELRGFLRKKLCIACSPTVAPLIYVVSATYGITPTGRRDRLEYIRTQLKIIEGIEHRSKEGLVLQKEDIKIIKTKPELLKQREIFQNIAINFIDVSIKLQKLCDKGGVLLHLDKTNFDPNFVFGNPSVGNNKILECCLDCMGHDSERMCESNEMTDTGHNRNFITIKKNRFNILVCDEPDTGKGVMMESLTFQTSCASPIIIVTKATYGEVNPYNVRDVSKLIDVTNEVQNRVQGRSLVMDTDINLNKLFLIDPSPGKRKQLRVEYVTRGFTGNLRVREKNDLLVAGIELGYPPVPPPDDDDYVLN